MSWCPYQYPPASGNPFEPVSINSLHQQWSTAEVWWWFGLTCILVHSKCEVSHEVGHSNPSDHIDNREESKFCNSWSKVQSSAKAGGEWGGGFSEQEQRPQTFNEQSQHSREQLVRTPRWRMFLQKQSLSLFFTRSGLVSFVFRRSDGSGEVVLSF